MPAIASVTASTAQPDIHFATITSDRLSRLARIWRSVPRSFSPEMASYANSSARRDSNPFTRYMRSGGANSEKRLSEGV